LFLFVQGIHAPGPDVFISLFVLLVLIVFSGLISASEVAYFSMSAQQLDTLTEKEDSHSRRVIELMNRPRYLLSTILICNNLVNVAIAIISFYMLKMIIDFSIYPLLGFLINVIGVTFFIVIFGEALPKTYATKHQMRVAYLLALPLYIARQIFWPVSYILVSSTKNIENRLRKNRSSNDISLEELEQAIDLTADYKTSKEEIGMLKGIVKFSNITVKQIMRARVDVFAIEDNVSFKELVLKVKESGYSRVPVFKETIDNITGVLYTKDLLGHLDKENFQWQQLLRQPLFVPESKKINDLLKDIQSSRNHLSIVVNEYGGMEGIITLEDILEEVIGDINDEYDDKLPESNFKKLDSYNYIFEGKTMLKEVQEVLGIKEDVFAEAKGEADSIAGLILELAGKFPEKNDEFSVDKYLFKVLDINRNRIQRVKITIRQ
jgi:putative hemolysin